MRNKLLQDINERVCDRSDCFYWQTDRKISADEAALVWKNRHSAIINSELLEKVNSVLDNISLSSIEPLDEKAQSSLGNVNSNRIGTLSDGRKVVIRCHPKGVKNGYFFSESLASELALKNGIPAYRTYTIHELEHEEDIAFQIIEKLSGDTVQFYLKEHPEEEEQLVYGMGKTMAKLHKTKVNGFGPFDNEKAKNGELVGIHSTLNSAVNAGLDENLVRLVANGLFSEEVATKIKTLFTNNELLNTEQAVLLHNDFADWNLLTDGNTITGVIDWDECVGGEPIEEIACWSTFFDPERLKPFLQGYFSETKEYENFENRFQLMRLRYTISKMALRIKRYTYEQTDFLKGMIEKGTKHLDELFTVFDLKNESKEKEETRNKKQKSK